MRWLITGAGGMLGRDLCALLARRGEPVTGLDRGALDITDADQVSAAVAGSRPDVVVNCAAWTNVDAAQSEPSAASRVNGAAVAGLASACERHDARLVQISTDYVFGGTGRRPYTEDDDPCPATEYGRGKLAGEGEVPATGYIVRTAWLYGAHGHNFVRTMISLAGRPGGGAVDVVADQYGQPTWTADVATQVLALVSSAAPAGIYHATSSGETSWHGLAREVFRLAGADPARVRAVSSDAYARARAARGDAHPAPRPAYSVLGHAAWTAAGLAPIRDWRLSLRTAFESLR